MRNFKWLVVAGLVAGTAACTQTAGYQSPRYGYSSGYYNPGYYNSSYNYNRSQMRSARRDYDRDGIPNRYDRDANGDGVPDRFQR